MGEAAKKSQDFLSLGSITLHYKLKICVEVACLHRDHGYFHVAALLPSDFYARLWNMDFFLS
jgi:hypothetical protein